MSLWWNRGRGRHPVVGHLRAMFSKSGWWESMCVCKSWHAVLQGLRARLQALCQQKETVIHGQHLILNWRIKILSVDPLSPWLTAYSNRTEHDKGTKSQLWSQRSEDCSRPITSDFEQCFISNGLMRLGHRDHQMAYLNHKQKGCRWWKGREVWELKVIDA